MNFSGGEGDPLLEDDQGFSLGIRTVAPPPHLIMLDRIIPQAPYQCYNNNISKQLNEILMRYLI